MEAGCDPWQRRREDGRTPLDLALKATNARGDRTRVIVYLRSVMNLTNTSYRSMLPSHPWRPLYADDSQQVEREEAERVEQEGGVGAGALSAGVGAGADCYDLDELDGEEESERGTDEYEWEGPPGDPIFPSPTPHPKGRWVRIKPKKERNATTTSAPPEAEWSQGCGNSSEEAVSEDVFVTLPPGPYVPPWLQSGHEDVDDDDLEDRTLYMDGQVTEDGGEGEIDRDRGSRRDKEGEIYDTVHEYFLAQKEEAAADAQLRAQVEYAREFNTSMPTAGGVITDGLEPLSQVRWMKVRFSLLSAMTCFSSST